ncbi:hypothetical protein H0H92_001937, partial [Tricholoma furcatifolium]
NVVRTACRVVVYEDTRTDYSNIAISEAVLDKIKKHCKNNGFKDFFENGAPTQARSDALMSPCLAQAHILSKSMRTTVAQSTECLAALRSCIMDKGTALT